MAPNNDSETFIAAANGNEIIPGFTKDAAGDVTAAAATAASGVNSIRFTATAGEALVQFARTFETSPMGSEAEIRKLLVEFFRFGPVKAVLKEISFMKVSYEFPIPNLVDATAFPVCRSAFPPK